MLTHMSQLVVDRRVVAPEIARQLPEQAGGGTGGANWR